MSSTDRPVRPVRATAPVQPGWHPAPGADHAYRYWDGAAWTRTITTSGTARHLRSSGAVRLATVMVRTPVGTLALTVLALALAFASVIAVLSML